MCGVVLSSVSFLASSWSTEVWHLIVLQGICAAIGGAMLFSPTTLFLDEWFRDGNRATAYGLTLSCKNIVGTGCPFLMYALIQRTGVRNAIRVWAGIVLVTGMIGLFIIPKKSTAIQHRRPQRTPWTFLKHRTFIVYALGNVVFSSGYGLPQTYLSQYASNVLHLSGIVSSLMIAAFNAPGIISCFLMGFLCDKSSLPASVNTQISTLGSALCVFLLWGLKSHEVPALLVLFSIGYGFFSGPYSSTWGGWISEMEREAADNNEAINTGMVYGLLNGARGIGYVVGGLSGVELLHAGAVEHSQKWAYGTRYGALILFTGLCSVLGGWSILWQCNGWKAAQRCWKRLR
jgi:MFS family permease